MKRLVLNCLFPMAALIGVVAGSASAAEAKFTITMDGKVQQKWGLQYAATYGFGVSNVAENARVAPAAPAHRAEGALEAPRRLRPGLLPSLAALPHPRWHGGIICPYCVFRSLALRLHNENAQAAA